MTTQEQFKRADGRYTVQAALITAFRGKAGVDYPDIPIAEGIDVAAMTEGDEKAMFVTLRIGEPGVVSGNGHYFSQEWVEDLARQVIERRTTGIMGHLSDIERWSAYPLPAVEWVGAMLHDGFAWGKAYVPPGDVREFLRRRMAQGGEVATSIYGTAEEMYWRDEVEAWEPVGFVLESLDLAPPERAGVPSLAVVPHLTAAMAGHNVEKPTKEHDMTKEEVLKALTAEDVTLLPDSVVQAVIAGSDQAQRLTAVEQQLATLRETLGVAEDGDLVAALQQHAEAARAQQEAAVQARIKALVEDPEQGVQVVALRSLVSDLVAAEKPGTPEEADTVFAQVMDRESVKEAFKASVETQMGGRQRRPVGAANGQNQFVIIPDDGEESES